MLRLSVVLVVLLLVLVLMLVLVLVAVAAAVAVAVAVVVAMGGGGTVGGGCSRVRQTEERHALKGISFIAMARARTAAIHMACSEP